MTEIILNTITNTFEGQACRVAFSERKKNWMPAQRLNNQKHGDHGNVKTELVVNTVTVTKQLLQLGAKRLSDTETRAEIIQPRS